MKRNGDTLRAWRQSRGWTQADLAAALRLSSTTIYLYESGRTVPSEAVRRDIEELSGGAVPFGIWPIRDRRLPHSDADDTSGASGEGCQETSEDSQ